MSSNDTSSSDMKDFLFEIGSLVNLKSGGAAMLIKDVCRDSDTIWEYTTIWMDTLDHVQIDVFKEWMLDPVKDK